MVVYTETGLSIHDFSKSKTTSENFYKQFLKYVSVKM